MGWKDAPLVEAQPKWASAPLVDEAPKQGDYRDDYAGQGMVEGNLNYAKDYGRGIVEAAKNSPKIGQVGAMETMLAAGTGAISPVLGGVDYALGKLGLEDPKNPTGSYAVARDKYLYEPRTEGGRAGTQLAGAALKPVGDLLSLAGTEASQAATKMGASEATSQDIRDATPDAIGLALGSRSMKRPAPKSAAVPKPEATRVPTKSEITDAAHAAYKKAEDAGVKVAPDSFDKMKTGLAASMRKEGINQTLHPDASAALKEIIDTKEAPTLLEIERLRRIAQDAEGSVKPADARLAGQLVDDIDDFVESVGDPGFKEARALWARKRKTDTIDELFRRAQLRETNYSSSGLENAIRGEFRSLATNERRMKRFNAEERAAIEQVAKGGKLDNALRQVGKFAPTDRFGQVTALLATIASGGAGALIPALGMGSRALATRATMKNANRAHELVRRGPIQEQAPRAPEQAASPQAQAMVEALEAEARKRGLFDTTEPTPMRAAAEADWQKRYALAKAVAERSVAQ